MKSLRLRRRVAPAQMLDAQPSRLLKILKSAQTKTWVWWGVKRPTSNAMVFQLSNFFWRKCQQRSSSLQACKSSIQGMYT